MGRDELYKLFATWSAPREEDVDEFEKHYREVHVPAAARVPHLRRIVLTRTDSGLEGAESAFYRVAEMSFDSPEDLAKSAESPEWQAMRADAGGMVERFGVRLSVGVGWERDEKVGS